MIRSVTGDILLSDAECIAHGVAPHDHFDHGLALSLRERWPALAKDFRHYCHNNNPKPGGVFMWAGPDETRGSIRIANLLTQEPSDRKAGHPGKATHHYVNHALKELAKKLEEEGIKSVALPKLATGVGGLDWADISPLIHQHLGGSGIAVLIYETYQAGRKAAEKLEAD